MAEIPIYVGPIIVVIAVIGFTIWLIARGKKD
jgi:hypothetical protein